MNDRTLPLTALCALAILVATDVWAQSPPAGTRTEDYAIISVFQRGKKNFVSVTVGSVSSEEKEYEAEKNDKRYDMAPIVEEMEKLNEQGYELVDHSAAIIPVGQYGGGMPFYSFVFKKHRP